MEGGAAVAFGAALNGDVAAVAHRAATNARAIIQVLPQIYDKFVAKDYQRNVGFFLRFR